MDTAQIGEKLVGYCRDDQSRKALDELYARDAVSIEASGPPGGDARTEGIEMIRGKHDWWDANFETHDTVVDGPYVNGDSFSVIFEIDATEKSSGQRMQMREVALYDVEDGKIARETFFEALRPH